MKRPIAPRRPSLTDRLHQRKPAGLPPAGFSLCSTSRGRTGMDPVEPAWRLAHVALNLTPGGLSEIRYFGLGAARIFTRWVRRAFGSTVRSETFIFSAFPKLIPG